MGGGSRGVARGEFRISSFEFRVRISSSNFEFDFRISSFEFRISNFEFRISNFEFRLQFSNSSHLVSSHAEGTKCFFNLACVESLTKFARRHASKNVEIRCRGEGEIVVTRARHFVDVAQEASLCLLARLQVSLQQRLRPLRVLPRLLRRHPLRRARRLCATFGGKLLLAKPPFSEERARHMTAPLEERELSAQPRCALGLARS